MANEWVRTEPDCPDLGWVRHVGIFDLHVWPDRPPYEARMLIPGDGDSNVLPDESSFGTLAKAKQWAEEALHKICSETLDALK